MIEASRGNRVFGWRVREHPPAAPRGERELIAVIAVTPETEEVPKSLKNWSGRPDSNRRRPAWEQVGWMCLQQLSVSGALYRLTASLAISAFSSLTPLIEVFSRYISMSFVPRFCAAFHGLFQQGCAGPNRLPHNHGSLSLSSTSRTRQTGP